MPQFKDGEQLRSQACEVIKAWRGSLVNPPDASVIAEILLKELPVGDRPGAPQLLALVDDCIRQSDPALPSKPPGDR